MEQVSVQPDRLVLASASPRRHELVLQIGITPAAIDPADIDETPKPRNSDFLSRIALAKAQPVGGSATPVRSSWRRIRSWPVAGACPKADDAATARRCLLLLSGRRHQVISGIAVIAPNGRANLRVVTTQVSFKRLTPQEIEAYIASGEWQGKAGGYRIQGRRRR